MIKKINLSLQHERGDRGNILIFKISH